jgi:hypothetical protein
MISIVLNIPIYLLMLSYKHFHSLYLFRCILINLFIYWWRCQERIFLQKQGYWLVEWSHFNSNMWFSELSGVLVKHGLIDRTLFFRLWKFYAESLECDKA